MKTMIVRTLLLTATATLLLSGCRHGGHHADSASAHLLAHLSDSLDLTAAQKSEVARICNDLSVTSTSLESMRLTWYNQAGMRLKGSTIDQKSLDAFVQEQKEQSANLIDQGALILVRLHAVLTPGQRQKLADEFPDLTANDR